MSKSGKELTADPWLNLMIIGKSGSGKTHLLAEGLKYEWMQPAYIYDTDLRLQSILSRFGPEVLDHIQFDQYRDLATTFGGAFAKAQAKKMELTRLIQRNDPMAPKSNIIDSGTFLAKLILNEALKLDGKAPDTKPGINHYGTLASTMERFISELTGLPCNIIFTVHENVMKDDVTGCLSWDIALIKYLRNTLPGYFNEVYQCTVRTIGKEIKYEVHPRPMGGYASRTCVPEMGHTEDHAVVWTKIDAYRKVTKMVNVLTV